MITQTAYKLLRRRKDGSLSPLFICRRMRIPVGLWIEARSCPTRGYAVRPGCHVAPKPHAPHLSTKGRVWMRVVVRDFQPLKRPASQGGVWWLAKWMKVLGEV